MADWDQRTGPPVKAVRSEDERRVADDESHNWNYLRVYEIKRESPHDSREQREHEQPEPFQMPSKGESLDLDPLNSSAGPVVSIIATMVTSAGSSRIPEGDWLDARRGRDNKNTEDGTMKSIAHTTVLTLLQRNVSLRRGSVFRAIRTVTSTHANTMMNPRKNNRLPMKLVTAFVVL